MARSLKILNVCQEAYPAIILLVFIIAFIFYGIFNAPIEVDKVKVHAMRGPGGRPLPQRRKSANQVKEAVAVNDFSPRSKLVFRVIQAGVLVTFVVNAVSLILQTLYYREDEWWAGQSAVVCPTSITAKRSY